jgi:hypothetical protein
MPLSTSTPKSTLPGMGLATWCARRSGQTCFEKASGNTRTGTHIVHDLVKSHWLGNFDLNVGTNKSSIREV